MQGTKRQWTGETQREAALTYTPGCRALPPSAWGKLGTSRHQQPRAEQFPEDQRALGVVEKDGGGSGRGRRVKGPGEQSLSMAPAID